MGKRLWMLAVAALIAMINLQAKVRLSHLVGDNMILQQQSEARLWGWTEKGRTVKVTVSWNSDAYEAKADIQGRWLVTVPTPKASYTPLSITFDDGEPLTINGVLAGEVWVCAGQSNMEMPIRGFGNCPVKGYNDVLIDARNHHAVHFCKVPSTMAMTPQDDAQCEWREISMQSVADASATGYFFGRLLHQALDIPIGLIEANKGGTRVESWLTRENLKKYTEEPLDSDEIVKKYDWDYHRPLMWGNGTFHPILNYTVKGIIFYQGCSNVDWVTPNYAELLALLVSQWRSQFALGELPFYFVQIAPYRYEDNDSGLLAARLRESQFRAQTMITNSHIVCTNDLVYPYEATQIHPCQKQQVGERLAYQALNYTYGMDKIMCESPSYKDMTIKGDTCFLHFQNDYWGMTPFEGITGFEVAGEDRIFHPAEASHFWQPGGGYWDEAIIVRSSDVKKPVAVRYCYGNFKQGNLKNQAHLPCFPFRTDNWE